MRRLILSLSILLLPWTADAAATLEQSQFTSKITTGTFKTDTFSVTPVAGHILVTAVAIDKVSGTITAPTGWTMIGTPVDGYNSTGAVAYKVSAGTEGSVTWIWNNPQAEAMQWLAEYSGVNTLDVFAENDTGNSVEDFCSTGTTGTTAIADSLAVAAWGADTYDNVDAGQAFTNSFIKRGGLLVGGYTGLIVATKDLSTTGTVQTTFSTTDTGDEMWGKVAVFNYVAPGPPPLDVDYDPCPTVFPPDVCYMTAGVTAQPPPDAVPPTVTIQSPTTGSLPGTSATVSIRAIDADSGVDSVWFTIEYCPTGGCTGEGAALPAGNVSTSLFSGDANDGVWHGTWTFANCGYDNNKWTIRGYAEDAAGNVNVVVPFYDDLILGGRGC
jgi:hypothetical protein